MINKYFFKTMHDLLADQPNKYYLDYFDFVTSMYHLLEYTYNYVKTSGVYDNIVEMNQMTI